MTLDRRGAVLLVVGVALAASVSGLGNGFAYDDIPIVVDNIGVHSLRWPWEFFGESYWGNVRGNSLYRPVTIMAYSLQWALGNGSPLPFHVVNVVLYALSSVAVWALARTLLAPWAALTAALLWAAHPVHVEAVANVVGQAEMLVALPLLAAVTLFVRALRDGRLHSRTVAAVLAAFALALLAKENGIVLPGLLLAAVATLGGRHAPLPTADRARLWLLARATALMAGVYLAARYAILGGLKGDAPHVALESLGHGERILTAVALWPEVARLLLWPARLYADYSPPFTPVDATPGWAHLGGFAVFALWGAAVAFSWRRSRPATFLLLWIPVTYAPVSNVVFASGILIAERTLFLPSVGVTLLAGVVMEALAPHVRALPSRWVRRAIPAALVAVLLAAVVRSAERQTVWEDNATLFAVTIVDAPNNYRAHHALGELFGSAGSWVRAEEHLRIADSLFPGYDLLELSLARVLHFADRCPEALPLYDTVLAKRPDAEVAAVGRAACLIETRQLSRARDASVLGLASGMSVAVFRPLLTVAESVLVAHDTIDARNRWWRAGRPVSQSDVRLRVPVLMMKPPGAGGRRRMPESLLVPPPPPTGVPRQDR